MKTQFGESLTADFEEKTWTFEMNDEDFTVGSGNFAIVPKDKYDESIAETENCKSQVKTLDSERIRLNAKVLQKNILIQKQSDKIKELDEELSYFINSSQEGMKLIEELRNKVKKANDILAFFDIRMKGNELYEQVKEEIKGGKEC